MTNRDVWDRFGKHALVLLTNLTALAGQDTNIFATYTIKDVLVNSIKYSDRDTLALSLVAKIRCISLVSRDDTLSQ